MNTYSIFTITLLSLILIGITVSSIIIIPDESIDYEEDEINEFIMETFDEIKNFIQIKDRMGKYYGDPPKIEKIVLLISPLFSSEFNMSSLKIKLDNGENVKILSYNGDLCIEISSYLFDNLLWDNVSEDEFGLLIINDDDNALQDYGVLNSNSDMAYVIINLENFSMNYKDTMRITFFPSTGWEKTIIITAELPISKIVRL